MAEVLVINEHDYSHLIKRKGVSWKRNDFDGDEAGRTTLDGRMHRDYIARKRTVKYSLMPAKREELAALDDDLSAIEFDAKYLDLHGVMTKSFYCTSFDAGTVQVDKDTGESLWENGSFSMIEM